jgi:hypothetical protein
VNFGVPVSQAHTSGGPEVARCSLQTFDTLEEEMSSLEHLWNQAHKGEGLNWQVGVQFNGGVRDRKVVRALRAVFGLMDSKQACLAGVRL